MSDLRENIVSKMVGILRGGMGTEKLLTAGIRSPYLGSHGRNFLSGLQAAGWGGVPLPLLGMMGMGSAQIIGNLLFGASPEEKWPSIFESAKASPYRKPLAPFNQNNNWYRGEFPSLAQLASNTKHNTGSNAIRQSSNPAPYGIKENEAFLNENRKPFVMLGADDARKLGYEPKGDRYGVSLNRYTSSKMAYDHRQRTKAEENRGGK